MPKEKNKTATVIYSGGKDSHLTLYKALKSGYKIPFLVYFNGGENHFKIFNDCLKTEIIREHAAMIGAELFICNVKSQKFSLKDMANIFINISKFAISNKYYISEIFSSFDFHDISENDSLVKKIDLFASSMGFKVNMEHSSKDVFQVLKKCEIAGIKVLIVSAEEKIKKDYLGKEINESFISYIRRERARGNFISGNDFQTLVVESPIFSKKIKVKKGEFFKSGRTNFFNIKNYELK